MKTKYTREEVITELERDCKRLGIKGIVTKDPEERGALDKKRNGRVKLLNYIKGLNGMNYAMMKY